MYITEALSLFFINFTKEDNQQILADRIPFNLQLLTSMRIKDCA